jgi:hypothetical protein
MYKNIFIGAVRAASLAILMLAFATACGGELSDKGGSEAPAASSDTGGEAGESEATVGVVSEDGNLTLPQLDRKIIRTARLELRVEKVSAAVQEVEDIAAAAGGWVSESNVFVDKSGDGNEGSVKRTETATVTIRVPAEAYRTVVGQLRGVAEEVKSESSQASEVTEEYTDLQARLRNQQATEAQFLDLLAKAWTIPDILTVQDKLNQVQLEIERVQGRINVLDSLTDMATITVELATFVPPTAGGGGHSWAENAWNAAWEGSQVTVVVLGSAAIVGGMVLAWLAIPLLVIGFGWWRYGKRLSRLLRQLSGQAPGGSGTPA